MAQPQERLVRALCQGGAYPHETQRIKLIETHISWVLLTGKFAYKLKKAIELPFLDFSSLQRRHHFCNEELRLNRRLAPELYVDVVAIGGTPEQPRVGETPAIEYAVKMVQFPRNATVDRQLAAGLVTRDQVRDLAQVMARFHIQLESSRGPQGDPAALENLRELDSCLDAARQARLEGIAVWSKSQLESVATLLDARQASGAVRECHGDLHLENLASIDGHIVPFDALEFDAALRCMDVMDEAAFTTMDFMAHERNDLAYEFLNSYLEKTGDYAGLAVLPHFLVKRALIRAKVHAIKAGQSTRSSEDAGRDWQACDRYLGLAENLTASRRPLLVITRGLSGSGKTTVSGELVARLGAVRVRSDLERKRLHGLAAGDSSDSAVGGNIYDSASSDATYSVLQDAARQGLEAGFDMIVDASFLQRNRRTALSRVASASGARCLIVDCRASDAELRRRIARRSAQGHDASEATSEVLDHQLAHRDELSDAELRMTVAVQTDEKVDYEGLLARLRQDG
jgi:aminoglycoside phosphotransferase family enzyme/predicted kinase